MKKDTRKKIDAYKQIHYDLSALLNIKDFVSIDKYMLKYCTQNAEIGALRTILIVTKYFQNEEQIKETRNEIKRILQSKINVPLV